MVTCLPGWRIERISVELIGWLAGISLTFCTVPQVCKCHKEGHAEGLAFGYLFFLFVGMLSMFLYVLGKYQFADKPLLFNYIFNVLLLLILWKYKIFPRDNDDDTQESK